MKYQLPNKIFGLENDYLFKKIFRNTEFLKLYLHDIFQIDSKDFHFCLTEFTKDNKNNSYGVCDLMLENENEIIILENQNRKKEHFEERTVAYLSKAYAEQWMNNHYHFKKVTLCWTLNYRYRQNELQEYQLLETKIHESFKDLLNVKIWNVKRKHKMDKVQLWASLFNPKKETLESLIEHPRLKPIIDTIINYNLDEQEYKKMKEDAHMWTIDDERKIDMSIAYDEGKEFGKREGKLENSIKIIRNMLSNGFDIPMISKITGMNEKQILKYANEKQ